VSAQREVIQFVSKTKYIHCNSVQIMHDGSVRHLETSTLMGGNNRLLMELHPEPNDVRFFFDYYDDITHECRFVNRILCCPSCRRSSVFCDRTGYLLHRIQLEDAAKSDDAWNDLNCGHPLVVWPCAECIGERYQVNHARAFLEDCLKVYGGEYRTRAQLCKMLGIRDDVFAEFIANGCPTTSTDGKECLIHAQGFAAWLSDAWLRRIDQYLIRWATPVAIIEQEEPGCEVAKAFRPVKLESTEPGVYLLIRGNEVVYVGQSGCVAKRIVSHLNDKKFDRAVYRPTTPDRLMLEERQLIEEFDPFYNRDLGTMARRSRQGRMTTNTIWRAN
jgi:hypothetical protein